jgi:hypothetical protein
VVDRSRLGTGLVTAAGSPAPLSDAVRDRARALCEVVQRSNNLYGVDGEICRATDALEDALDAAEAGDAAGPQFTETVIPAETGPCYDAHGVERPPNPECVLTTGSFTASRAALADRMVEIAWAYLGGEDRNTVLAASRALRRDRETLARALYDTLSDYVSTSVACRDGALPLADAVLAALAREEG